MKVSFNAAKIDFIQCVLVDYMPEDKVIEIWNEMDSTRMGANQIYHMNKIDAVLQNEKPMNILHLTNHDEFDLNHKFFTFDISNPNKHMLISSFCFDLFKFFSYDDIINYIILTKNKTVMSYIDMHEMKKAFLDEMLLGDAKKVEDILTKLVDSKFVDLFSDDWDKIAKLIFDLLG